jgi:DNA-binding winged helix-turn-helix (wHTH) protein/Tfp pilus assembly protein PilF
MRYRFGAFELDADQYELRRDGNLVHVEPRVLDVLFFLVRNRDRVVSREELLDSVWKTRYIGESALSRCIMQARKAVKDDAADDAIKTLHRRGYRFVAPIEEEAAETAPEPSQKRTSAIDPQAEKLFARAQQLAKKRSPEGIRNAIALLIEAIEFEPHYAPAHAALGDCYLFLGFLQLTEPRSVFTKAQASLDRAIELDPGLAEAYASRGFIEMVYGWNREAAGIAFDDAMRLGSDRAIVQHRWGLYLLSQRRIDEAEAALLRAVALDPLSPIFATACGLAPMARGDAQRAISIYRNVIESEPSFYPVHFYSGLALESCGRSEDAITAFREALQISNTETEALPALAHVLAQTGREDEAEAIRARLAAAASERFISPFFFAVVALGRGVHDECLAWLEQAIELRAMRMHDLHLDPRFAPLHGDARFRSLLARIGMDPDATAEPKWWRSRGSR